MSSHTRGRSMSRHPSTGFLAPTASSLARASMDSRASATAASLQTSLAAATVRTTRLNAASTSLTLFPKSSVPSSASHPILKNSCSRVSTENIASGVKPHTRPRGVRLNNTRAVIDEIGVDLDTLVFASEASIMDAFLDNVPGEEESVADALSRPGLTRPDVNTSTLAVRPLSFAVDPTANSTFLAHPTSLSTQTHSNNPTIPPRDTSSSSPSTSATVHLLQDISCVLRDTDPAHNILFTHSGGHNSDGSVRAHGGSRDLLNAPATGTTTGRHSSGRRARSVGVICATHISVRTPSLHHFALPTPAPHISPAPPLFHRPHTSLPRAQPHGVHDDGVHMDSSCAHSLSYSYAHTTLPSSATNALYLSPALSPASPAPLASLAVSAAVTSTPPAHSPVSLPPRTPERPLPALPLHPNGLSEGNASSSALSLRLGLHSPYATVRDGHAFNALVAGRGRATSKEARGQASKASSMDVGSGSADSLKRGNSTPARETRQSFGRMARGGARGDQRERERAHASTNVGAALDRPNRSVSFSVERSPSEEEEKEGGQEGENDGKSGNALAIAARSMRSPPRLSANSVGFYDQLMRRVDGLDSANARPYTTRSHNTRNHSHSRSCEDPNEASPAPVVNDTDLPWTHDGSSASGGATGLTPYPPSLSDPDTPSSTLLSIYERLHSQLSSDNLPALIATVGARADLSLAERRTLIAQLLAAHASLAQTAPLDATFASSMRSEAADGTIPLDFDHSIDAHAPRLPESTVSSVLPSRVSALPLHSSAPPQPVSSSQRHSHPSRSATMGASSRSAASVAMLRAAPVQRHYARAADTTVTTTNTNTPATNTDDIPPVSGSRAAAPYPFLSLHTHTPTRSPRAPPPLPSSLALSLSFDPDAQPHSPGRTMGFSPSIRRRTQVEPPYDTSMRPESVSLRPDSISLRPCRLDASSGGCTRDERVSAHDSFVTLGRFPAIHGSTVSTAHAVTGIDIAATANAVDTHDTGEVAVYGTYWQGVADAGESSTCMSPSALSLSYTAHFATHAHALAPTRVTAVPSALALSYPRPITTHTSANTAAADVNTFQTGEPECLPDGQRLSFSLEPRGGIQDVSVVAASVEDTGADAVAEEVQKEPVTATGVRAGGPGAEVEATQREYGHAVQNRENESAAAVKKAKAIINISAELSSHVVEEAAITRDRKAPLPVAATTEGINTRDQSFPTVATTASTAIPSVHVPAPPRAHRHPPLPLPPLPSLPTPPTVVSTPPLPLTSSRTLPFPSPPRHCTDGVQSADVPSSSNPPYLPYPTLPPTPPTITPTPPTQLPHPQPSFPPCNDPVFPRQPAVTTTATHIHDTMNAQLPPPAASLPTTDIVALPLPTATSPPLSTTHHHTQPCLAKYDCHPSPEPPHTSIGNESLLTQDLLLQKSTRIHDIVSLDTNTRQVFVAAARRASVAAVTWPISAEASVREALTDVSRWGEHTAADQSNVDAWLDDDASIIATDAAQMLESNVVTNHCEYTDQDTTVATVLLGIDEPVPTEAVQRRRALKLRLALRLWRYEAQRMRRQEHSAAQLYHAHALRLQQRVFEYWRQYLWLQIRHHDLLLARKERVLRRYMGLWRAKAAASLQYQLLLEQRLEAAQHARRAPAHTGNLASALAVSPHLAVLRARLGLAATSATSSAVMHDGDGFGDAPIADTRAALLHCRRRTHEAQCRVSAQTSVGGAVAAAPSLSRVQWCWSRWTTRAAQRLRVCNILKRAMIRKHTPALLRVLRVWRRASDRIAADAAEIMAAAVTHHARRMASRALHHWSLRLRELIDAEDTVTGTRVQRVLRAWVELARARRAEAELCERADMWHAATAMRAAVRRWRQSVISGTLFPPVTATHTQAHAHTPTTSYINDPSAPQHKPSVRVLSLGRPLIAPFAATADPWAEDRLSMHSAVYSDDVTYRSNQYLPRAAQPRALAPSTLLATRPCQDAPTQPRVRSRVLNALDLSMGPSSAAAADAILAWGKDEDSDAPSVCTSGLYSLDGTLPPSDESMRSTGVSVNFRRGVSVGHTHELATLGSSKLSVLSTRSLAQMRDLLMLRQAADLRRPRISARMLAVLAVGMHRALAATRILRQLRLRAARRRQVKTLVEAGRVHKRMVDARRAVYRWRDWAASRGAVRTHLYTHQLQRVQTAVATLRAFATKQLMRRALSDKIANWHSSHMLQTAFTALRWRRVLAAIKRHNRDTATVQYGRSLARSALYHWLQCLRVRRQAASLLQRHNTSNSAMASPEMITVQPLQPSTAPLATPVFTTRATHSAHAAPMRAAADAAVCALLLDRPTLHSFVSRRTGYIVPSQAAVERLYQLCLAQLLPGTQTQVGKPPAHTAHTQPPRQLMQPRIATLALEFLRPFLFGEPSSPPTRHPSTHALVQAMGALHRCGLCHQLLHWGRYLSSLLLPANLARLDALAALTHTPDLQALASLFPTLLPSPPGTSPASGNSSSVHVGGVRPLSTMHFILATCIDAALAHALPASHEDATSPFTTHDRRLSSQASLTPTALRARDADVLARCLLQYALYKHHMLAAPHAVTSDDTSDSSTLTLPTLARALLRPVSPAALVLSPNIRVGGSLAQIPINIIAHAPMCTPAPLPRCYILPQLRERLASPDMHRTANSISIVSEASQVPGLKLLALEPIFTTPVPEGASDHHQTRLDGQLGTQLDAAVDTLALAVAHVTAQTDALHPLPSPVAAAAVMSCPSLPPPLPPLPPWLPQFPSHRPTLPTHMRTDPSLSPCAPLYALPVAPHTTSASPPHQPLLPTPTPPVTSPAVIYYPAHVAAPTLPLPAPPVRLLAIPSLSSHAAFTLTVTDSGANPTTAAPDAISVSTAERAVPLDAKNTVGASVAFSPSLTDVESTLPASNASRKSPPPYQPLPHIPTPPRKSATTSPLSHPLSSSTPASTSSSAAPLQSLSHSPASPPSLVDAMMAPINAHVATQLQAHYALSLLTRTFLRWRSHADLHARERAFRHWRSECRAAHMLQYWRAESLKRQRTRVFLERQRLRHTLVAVRAWRTALALRIDQRARGELLTDEDEDGLHHVRAAERMLSSVAAADITVAAQSHISASIPVPPLTPVRTSSSIAALTPVPVSGLVAATVADAIVDVQPPLFTREQMSVRLSLRMLSERTQMGESAQGEGDDDEDADDEGERDSEVDEEGPEEEVEDQFEEQQEKHVGEEGVGTGDVEYIDGREVGSEREAIEYAGIDIDAEMSTDDITTIATTATGATTGGKADDDRDDDYVDIASDDDDADAELPRDSSASIAFANSAVPDDNTSDGVPHASSSVLGALALTPTASPLLSSRSRRTPSLSMTSMVSTARMPDMPDLSRVAHATPLEGSSSASSSSSSSAHHILPSQSASPRHALPLAPAILQTPLPTTTPIHSPSSSRSTPTSLSPPAPSAHPPPRVTLSGLSRPHSHLAHPPSMVPSAAYIIHAFTPTHAHSTHTINTNADLHAANTVTSMANDANPAACPQTSHASLTDTPQRRASPLQPLPHPVLHPSVTSRPACARPHPHARMQPQRQPQPQHQPARQPEPPSQPRPQAQQPQLPQQLFLRDAVDAFIWRVVNQPRHMHTITSPSRLYSGSHIDGDRSLNDKTALDGGYYLDSHNQTGAYLLDSNSVIQSWSLASPPRVPGPAPHADIDAAIARMLQRGEPLLDYTAMPVHAGAGVFSPRDALSHALGQQRGDEGVANRTADATGGRGQGGRRLVRANAGTPSGVVGVGVGIDSNRRTPIRDSVRTMAATPAGPTPRIDVPAQSQQSHPPSRAHTRTRAHTQQQQQQRPLTRPHTPQPLPIRSPVPVTAPVPASTAIDTPTSASTGKSRGRALARSVKPLRVSTSEWLHRMYTRASADDTCSGDGQGDDQDDGHEHEHGHGVGSGHGYSHAASAEG